MLNPNSESIQRELEWFKSFLIYRFSIEKSGGTGKEEEPAAPAHENSCYAEFIGRWKLSSHERIALMLGLIPHINPGKLDVFLTVNEKINKSYTEFGGKRSSNSQYFLPTGETFLHIVAGNDTQQRIAAAALLEPAASLARNQILYLDEVPPGEPRLSGTIQVVDEVIDYITTGRTQLPRFGTNFPAKVYTSELGWDDMVFGFGTRQMVEEVKIWLKHHRTLLDEMGYSKRLGKGYKALFHGPPGNGKSVTAALLGRHIGKEVLRIDLSMVVSKYIGETEKNLKKVFDRAERIDAILFFDEADALFGKRTAVKDAHDRYANQEVNYLLQRIEAFSGIVLLATNFKSNLDEAFSRRFQTMVYFPPPEREERLTMWRKVLNGKVSLAPEVKLEEIAEKYALSFAQIANVGAWCALMALERGDLKIDQQLLRTGLARELSKESRTL